jgi:hypothetical protein
MKRYFIPLAAPADLAMSAAHAAKFTGFWFDANGAEHGLIALAIP